MSLELDDLPRIDSATRLGRRAGDTAVADAYASHRAEEGIQLSSLHFSIGEQAMSILQNRVFPSSGKLAALTGPVPLGPGVSYTTYSDCTVFNYDGTCNSPCFGYAPDHMSSWYCATCAEQAADPSHNPPWNWHFTGSRGQIHYMDQPSNPCNGRDAWKWQVGACGNCQQNAIFRCHDGYKQVQSGPLEPTICEGLISCDNNLTHCP